MGETVLLYKWRHLKEHVSPDKSSAHSLQCVSVCAGWCLHHSLSLASPPPLVDHDQLIIAGLPRLPTPESEWLPKYWQHRTHPSRKSSSPQDTSHHWDSPRWASGHFSHLFTLLPRERIRAAKLSQATKFFLCAGGIASGKHDALTSGMITPARGAPRQVHQRTTKPRHVICSLQLQISQSTRKRMQRSFLAHFAKQIHAPFDLKKHFQREAKILITTLRITSRLSRQPSTQVALTA